ncbi:MAG TPA: acyl-CoA dehydrogenase family protein [Acidimicrobiales bacterium]|nr:acyl-CoA dehydrogenase family protein [Acidimicrobiales bacterium]
MNLELSDEQLALRDAVRRFLTERAPVAGHVRALLDDPVGTTDGVWHGLAALGATGLLVPERHGGAGMGMVEAGVVLEELGRALDPGPWSSSAVAAPRALRAVEGGDVAKLLAGIADGSVVATVALPVTDLSVAGGDEATLEGTIAEVPDAAAAQVLLLPVAEAACAALFAVETSAPGVTVTPLRRVDGSRKQARVTLVGAPAERLGSLSAAAVEALFDDVLVARGADALGAAQAVLELAVAYAKARVQFGQPIGAFQAVQHLCVDMLETVELARGGVLHALWAADHADAATRHLAATELKAFAGHLAHVGDMAIQVFGGIGYTWEHDAQLYLKRLLSWSAFLGSPDRYLVETGRLLVRSQTR